MKISVIIPTFNEVATIGSVIEKVKKSPYEKEIIVVDDGSLDGTRVFLDGMQDQDIIKIFHDSNLGKGASIRSALSRATGDIVIVQDADLEYNPDEYPVLLEPILSGRADVVFGSRFMGAHSCFLFTHYVGNRVANLIANILYNTNLTDFMTGYKVFSRKALGVVSIRSNRFGFEAEITGIVFRKNLRVCEVPISYSGRNFKEGKKIKWQDFFVVVWWLIYARICR